MGKNQKSPNWTRLANNFIHEKTGGNYSDHDVHIISEGMKYAEEANLKTYKVALLFICLNSPYWQYIRDAMSGADRYFLPGHQVDKYLWTDLHTSSIAKDATYGATIIETDPIGWPYPTLLRYDLIAQREEILKEYDYVFYCDIDMRFVGYVGDEILSDGITAAQHPMYALRDELYPPFERNPQSEAYIDIPGVKVGDVFKPMYYAGGFQGGTAKSFLKAINVIRKNITKDLDNQNYIARWNDESHWNKYLSKHPPAKVISPSYVYPDSLIEEYYKKIWGRDYPPKIVTLTKKFTTSKEAGKELQEKLKTL